MVVRKQREKLLGCLMLPLAFMYFILPLGPNTCCPLGPVWHEGEMMWKNDLSVSSTKEETVARI